MCRYCGLDAGTPWKTLTCVVPRVRNGQVVSVDVGREGPGRFGQLAARLIAFRRLSHGSSTRVLSPASSVRQQVSPLRATLSPPNVQEDSVTITAPQLVRMPIRATARPLTVTLLVRVRIRLCGVDAPATQCWKPGCIHRWHGGPAVQPARRGR